MRAERGAAVMPHEGGRNISAPVSVQPGPIRQIDVLVRGEEVRVETAELLENGFGHQAGRAADPNTSIGVSAASTRSPWCHLNAPPARRVRRRRCRSSGVVHIDDARRRPVQSRPHDQCRRAGPQPVDSATVSLFRNARNAPRASCAPALLPPAKPRFSQADDAHGGNAHDELRRPIGGTRCPRG